MATNLNEFSITAPRDAEPLALMHSLERTKKGERG
jgi:hypothetical protein